MGLVTIKDPATGEDLILFGGAAKALNEAVYNAGRNTGYGVGYDEGKADAEKQYYKTTVKGDGTQTLSFNLPEDFDPDVITVVCKDVTTAHQLSVAVLFAAVARRSNAGLCGTVTAGNAGATTTAYIETSTLDTLFTRGENGDATVGNFKIGSKRDTDAYFGDGVQYDIFLEKLPAGEGTT